jgi:peptidyl-prolyl cis-trans isomerase A (cyclophilin A)
MTRMRQLLMLTLAVVLFACSGQGKKGATGKKEENAAKKTPEKVSFGSVLPSVFSVTTYDGKRRLEQGMGFFVNDSVAVSLYSLFGNSNRAEVQPLNGNKTYEVAGFLAVDRINDLVLLKIKNLHRPGLKLYTGHVPQGALTYVVSPVRGNTVPVGKGKMLEESTIQGNRVFRLSNVIYGSTIGRPIFLKNHEVLGVGSLYSAGIEQDYLAIPAELVEKLLRKQDEPLKPLSRLGGKVPPAVSAANAKIKGVRVETDYGNITIRLFNNMPLYRDNFLKLVREHYYDSLLWHRVIAKFVIQTGAADTRHAKPGDMVGWKGPGYTLPANINPKYFHRRGMVGVPRLPDRQNRYKRSDGSQFYIVVGRTYSDSELDDIEKEHHIKFSPEQRRVYKTIGGAPTLDGEYTIFGEVTSGMDVADRIDTVSVDKYYRPLRDIRVKRIRILK